MPFFSRRTSCKPPSLPYMFSKLLPFDRYKGGEIADDWEFVGVLDTENEGEEGDPSIQEEDADMSDQLEPYLSSLQICNSIKMKYKILTKDDLLQLLEDKITQVSTVCELQRNEAALLLQHFKWDANRTSDEWMEYQEKVRKEVGLFVRPVVETPSGAAEIACNICGVNYPGNDMSSVSCGHQICNSCWEGYIREAINDGPRCLTLRCPELSCDAAVHFDLIKHLSSEDDKKNFENHLLRSFSACSNEIRWCPAPECNYSVFSSNGEQGNVTCRCLYSFCWNCSGQAHTPVDCDTVAQWMSEIVSRSEDWLLANTTSCPKCTVAIDNRSNTLYEKCPTCEHEYCSVCGDDWYEYGTEDTEGHYRTHSCILDYGRMSLNKIPLERFECCYEGWVTCESSRANALTDLHILQEFQLELLGNIFGISPKDLDFLREVRLQVVECWQFLKWTHVYGFYLPASEDDPKRCFLEFLQGDATVLLGHLQKQVDELLQEAMEKNCPSAEFSRFRTKIITLTSVGRNYFDGFMESAKSGFSEVGGGPKPGRKHKISCDLEEMNSSGKSSMQCLNISQSSSPIAKVMRSTGNMDVQIPIDSSKPADYFTIELKIEPKNENN